METLILHSHESGPNPYKVAILCEALKLPYHIKLWEFGDADNGVKGPIFTKINENGRVPALEDPNTGVVAWESGAVINYILREYDTTHALFPGPSSPKQVHVDFDKWIFFLVSTMGPMMGQTNWYRHYNPVKNEDALKRYQAQAYRCFDVLEGQLKKSGGKSVLEGGFSAVDVHFYPWVWEYEYGGLSIETYPNVRTWFKGIGDREDVKLVYEKIPQGEKA
ncbi:hypothetical protein MMC12_005187 [Toensbergia leucococca]|nr:hypothetical protein [Toensbergia leucococca]